MTDFGPRSPCEVYKRSQRRGADETALPGCVVPDRAGNPIAHAHVKIYLFTKRFVTRLWASRASTVSLEMCMFGKPVINVAYNPPGVDIFPFDYGRFYSFDHYRPVVDSGAVAVAWDESNMRGMIRDALSRPGAAKEQQEKLLDTMFGSTLTALRRTRADRVEVDGVSGPARAKRLPKARSRRAALVASRNDQSMDRRTTATAGAVDVLPFPRRRGSITRVYTLWPLAHGSGHIRTPARAAQCFAATERRGDEGCFLPCSRSTRVSPVPRSRRPFTRGHGLKRSNYALGRVSFIRPD